MAHNAVRNVTTIHKTDNENITAIILSAGMGKRMKSYGPKALLDYHGKSILEWAIEIIRKEYPGTDIIVVTGFEEHKFECFSNRVRIIHNIIHDKTNPAYSLKLGLQAAMGQKIIVMHGDLIFSSSAIHDLAKGPSKIVISDTMSEDDVGVYVEDEHVRNIGYNERLKWGQITYFTGKEYQLLRHIMATNTVNLLFVHEIIKQIISQGGKFKIHYMPNIHVHDIDSPKDRQKINDIWLT
jgi:choline kinase